MAIRRKMTLASPISNGEFSTLSGFEMLRVHLENDHLNVYLNPSHIPSVRIYPAGAPNVVEGKGVIVLGAVASAKVATFVSALEDVIKSNLEFPWPSPQA